MNPILIGVAGLIVFFGLLALGLPIALSLAAVGFGGLLVLLGFTPALSLISTTPFETLSSYDLSCIPLFILMATICFESGIGSDMYNLASKWLGQLRGGLGIATIAACAMFSAISSSGAATTITMGTVAIPEMKKFKYGPELIAGSVISGGTLGPLIPPSGLFIYYGILTETSIGALFIAGILPGIVMAIFFSVAIYIMCLVKPSLGPAGPKTSLYEKIMALAKSGEVIALILLVLGGLTVGLFTPTEAGAVGAFGALFIALIRKRLTWQKFARALMEAMKTSGVLYLIFVGVNIFIPFMTLSEIPASLSNFVIGLNVAPIIVIICIVVMYIVLGTFMEEGTMMFVTVPIIAPIVFKLGFDPVWYGVLVVLMMMNATISPPVGMSMFLVAALDRSVPMTAIYRGTIPFFLANIVVIFLLIFFPSIALFLPSLLK